MTGVNDELMRYIKDEIAMHRRLKVVDSPAAPTSSCRARSGSSARLLSNFNSALEPTKYNQNIVVSAALKDLHAKKTIWTTGNVSAAEHTSIVAQTTVTTTPTFLEQNLRGSDIAHMTDLQTAQTETSASRDVMMQRLAQNLYAEMAEGF